MAEENNPSQFDENASDMSLAWDEADVPVNEEDIAMATKQLGSLIAQFNSGSNDAAGDKLDGVGAELVAVKQELLSPTKSLPPHRAHVAADVSTHSQASHGQSGEGSSSSTSGTREEIHSKRPRTEPELRVSVKRLPPAMIAAVHRKNGTGSIRPNVWQESSSSSVDIRTDPQSLKIPSSSMRGQSSKTSKTAVNAKDKSSVRSRTNLTSTTDRAQCVPSGDRPHPSRGKTTMDDLSHKELKLLLMKSQATIRSLSNKLNEWKKSENEVFGRLIGKMIGGIKNRRRQEGVKLHVHDLVCETILQDMEESRT